MESNDTEKATGNTRLLGPKEEALEMIKSPLSENDFDSFARSLLSHFCSTISFTDNKCFGGVSIFNPEQGKLCLVPAPLIGTNFKLEIMAEKVANVVKSLVWSPDEVFVMRNDLKIPEGYPLELFLMTPARFHEFHIPIQEILRIDKISSRISKVEEVHVFNVYDDWLVEMPACEAFLRLTLIIKAFNAARKETNNILKVSTTEGNHLWPSLSHEDWAEVEANLAKLIINEYVKANCMALPNKSKMIHVLLGMEEHISLRMGNIFPLKHKEIKSDESACELDSDWRDKALAIATIPFVRKEIEVPYDSLKNGFIYMIPQNIVQQFRVISDTEVQIAGFLYGVNSPRNPMVKEIKTLVIPPQLGTVHSVRLPLSLPMHVTLNALKPLGWIHTHSVGLPSRPSAHDVAMHAGFVTGNASWDSEETIIMTCSFNQDQSCISGFKVTPHGFAWAHENGPTESFEGHHPSHYERVRVLRSDHIGVIMSPSESFWNFHFDVNEFNPYMQYEVQTSDPWAFNHQAHLPNA